MIKCKYVASLRGEACELHWNLQRAVHCRRVIKHDKGNKRALHLVPSDIHYLREKSAHLSIPHCHASPSSFESPPCSCSEKEQCIKNVKNLQRKMPYLSLKDGICSSAHLFTLKHSQQSHKRERVPSEHWEVFHKSR